MAWDRALFRNAIIHRDVQSPEDPKSGSAERFDLGPYSRAGSDDPALDTLVQASAKASHVLGRTIRKAAELIRSSSTNELCVPTRLAEGTRSTYAPVPLCGTAAFCSVYGVPRWNASPDERE